MPQPYASALTTAEHSAGDTRLTKVRQFASIAERSMERMPPASASGGPTFINVGSAEADVSALLDFDLRSRNAIVWTSAKLRGPLPQLATYNGAGEYNWPLRRCGNNLRRLLAKAHGQSVFLSKIRKAGHRCLELQHNGAGWTVTLLSDDDLGLAMDRLHLGLPLEIFLGSRAGFSVLDVVFLAEDKHHDVRVLFNGARFSQVR